MNKNLLKLAASKAARMLGLGALVMSFGALSLTSCDDDDIETVAAQLPVVVIDTPLEGTTTATRAFIGTDNRTAGANFAKELLADAPESIPDAYTCLILRLKDSPAIAERVESYKSVLPVAMEETLTKANK